jgi:hypothetical protein
MKLTIHFHLVLRLSLELHFDSPIGLYYTVLNYLIKNTDKFTTTSLRQQWPLIERNL